MQWPRPNLFERSSSLDLTETGSHTICSNPQVNLLLVEGCGKGYSTLGEALLQHSHTLFVLSSDASLVIQIAIQYSDKSWSTEHFKTA